MTEPTPLNVIELMRVVMDADNETRGFALRGTTNWAAHIGKAVQNAVIAKLWTPEQIAEAKERAKKFEPWLLTNQEPLGAEFEAVLDKNRSELYAEATPQPTQAQAGAVPLDKALRLFDAGWKAAALFCDREDVVADGIIGFGACPQFEAAFAAARARLEKAP